MREENETAEQENYVTIRTRRGVTLCPIYLAGLEASA